MEHETSDKAASPPLARKAVPGGAAAKPWLGPLIALVVSLAIGASLTAWAPLSAYQWLKALHIIAVISWMAGMLYLPRLFVYHCAAERGSQQSETFKVMERRLLSAIMAPAMVATWVFGLWLAWSGGWLASGWLHGKLAMVLVMSGMHGFFQLCAKDFALDRNERSQRFYRAANEIPTLLMIAIVILVVVKPF